MCSISCSIISYICFGVGREVRRASARDVAAWPLTSGRRHPCSGSPTRRQQGYSQMRVLWHDAAQCKSHSIVPEYHHLSAIRSLPKCGQQLRRMTRIGPCTTHITWRRARCRAPSCTCYQAGNLSQSRLNVLYLYIRRLEVCHCRCAMVGVDFSTLSVE